MSNEKFCRDCIYCSGPKQRGFDKECWDFATCSHPQNSEQEYYTTDLVSGKKIKHYAEYKLCRDLRARGVNTTGSVGKCRKAGHLFVPKPLGSSTETKISKEPWTCEHANEVPCICPCSSDCYCKNNTCKER